MDALTEKMNEIEAQRSALLAYANETTGVGDTRLGDAVRTLVDGYGQGGSTLDGIPTVTDSSKSMAYMLSAIKNGTAKSGTKTWTEAFPNTGTLALETGLSEIHGIMLNVVDSDWAAAIDNFQRARTLFIVVNTDGSLTAQSVDASGNGSFERALSQGSVLQRMPLNGSVRFDGGNMYCAGRYNKNQYYQMVFVGKEYEWIAW